jgi:hypothetical protein
MSDNGFTFFQHLVFWGKAAYANIYPELEGNFWRFGHPCSRSAHTGSVIRASLLKIMRQQIAFQQRSGILIG